MTAHENAPAAVTDAQTYQWTARGMVKSALGRWYDWNDYQTLLLEVERTRALLREARPAIEAGAEVLDNYAPDCAAQLRALISIDAKDKP